MGEDVGKPVVRLQVPEDDPEYLDGRVWGRRKKMMCFGEEAVLSLDSNMQVLGRILDSRRDLSSALEEITDGDSEQAERLLRNVRAEGIVRQDIVKGNGALRTAFKKLITDTENLCEMDGGEDIKGHISSSIRHMLATSEIQDELRGHFGGDLSGFTGDRFWSKVNNGAISDGLLYAAAKIHIEDIREQEIQLQTIFEQTKAEFKMAVMGAVDRGLLPQAAINALNRIDPVVISLHDRLLDILTSDIGGCDQYGGIEVSSELLQENSIPKLKHTIFHELLHELSGKSITVSTEVVNEPDRWGKFTSIYNRKSGVSLHRPALSFRPNAWLNEAITEWLALELSGYSGDTGKVAYKGSASYTNERKELDRLFESGLERDTVINAYFENFVSDQPKEEKGRHFTKLVRRINEIEGPTGFSKLENKHIMRDIENTLYEAYARPAKSVNTEEAAIPPGTKIFHINVEVGTQQNTRITKEFVYVARPITDETGTVSVEDRWKPVKNALDAIKAKYGGKVNISIS